jgi:hypothetical protein
MSYAISRSLTPKARIEQAAKTGTSAYEVQWLPY